MLEVTDVPVSPSSVVTELCEVFSGCSDWEDVVLESLSFSKERPQCCTSAQEELRYEAHKLKRLRCREEEMTPPTPLQNSYASVEGEQGPYEREDQRWSARGRALRSLQERNIFFLKEVTV